MARTIYRPQEIVSLPRPVEVAVANGEIVIVITCIQLSIRCQGIPGA